MSNQANAQQGAQGAAPKTAKNAAAAAPVDAPAPGGAELVRLDPKAALGDLNGRKPVQTKFYFWSPAYQEKEERTGRIIHEEYVPIRGILLGRFRRPEGWGAQNLEQSSTHFYVICVTHPTIGRDLDKNVVNLKPGDMAWVDERPALAPLSGMLPRYGILPGTNRKVMLEATDLAIEPVALEEFKAKGTGQVRKSWKFNLYPQRVDAQKLDAALVTLPALPVGSGPEAAAGNEDIPF